MKYRNYDIICTTDDSGFAYTDGGTVNDKAVSSVPKLADSVARAYLVEHHCDVADDAHFHLSHHHVKPDADDEWQVFTFVVSFPEGKPWLIEVSVWSEWDDGHDCHYGELQPPSAEVGGGYSWSACTICGRVESQGERAD